MAVLNKLIARTVLFTALLLISFFAKAKNIIVNSIDEFKTANKEALAGDVIVLANKEWKDVIFILTCTGTENQPITVKAQTPGKVMITGHSQLKIGGNYIIVDGLYFTSGYAGDDAVIDFR